MDNKLITKIKYSVGNSLERNINFNSSDQKLEELKNVSNQFESIFINQVLKQARQGKIADGILNSDAEETFNTMIDQEYSKILSEKSNFGIAEAIFDQFKMHVGAKRK